MSASHCKSRVLHAAGTTEHNVPLLLARPPLLVAITARRHCFFSGENGARHQIRFHSVTGSGGGGRESCANCVKSALRNRWLSDRNFRVLHALLVWQPLRRLVDSLQLELRLSMSCMRY